MTMRAAPAIDRSDGRGHCGLPTDELVPLAEKLLQVPQQLIRAALDLELQEGTVIADQVGKTPCVFLAGLHRAERTIAERLTRLANGPLPWPWIDPNKALPWSRSTSASPLPKAKSRHH
jgi:exodeoxyribonuclease V alpha subunit